SGMGATAVLAYFRGPRVFLVNLGDSRGYACRDGSLQRVTEDHSIVGMLVREGSLRPEEAQDHPSRGVLSRFVGMENAVDPDVHPLPLAAPTRILLCSDGLTQELSDDFIEATLQSRPDPQGACDSLIAAARARGARDNVTAVVIDVEAALQPGEEKG